MNKYTAIGAIGALSAASYFAMNYTQEQLSAYAEDFLVDDEENWLSMPDGKMYHKSCIYHHDTEFKIDNISGSVQTLTKENKNGELTSEELAPCAHEPRLMKKEGEVDNLSYYSDWAVYAQTTQNTNFFSTMSSKWVVPPAPKKWGPAGLSSVYIFNGLEDGGGVHGKSSLILQPVVQFGKSGCLNDPLLWHEWHLTSYLVDGNGRAHCGKRIWVGEGETVFGGMVQVDKETNSWEVTSIREKTGETSKYTGILGNMKMLNAAYLTLEGMIIYNCQTWPTNSGIEFFDNKLKDGNGKTIDSETWSPRIRHTECNQAVNVEKNGSVQLNYDSTM